MSAYALPSAFLPPVGSNHSCTINKSKTTVSVSDINNKNKNNDCNNDIDKSIDEDKTHDVDSGPLHKSSSNECSFGTLILSSVDRLCPPLLYGSGFDNKSISKKEDGNDITVKEAKIDPVRLVQSISSSPRQSTSNTTADIRRRRNTGFSPPTSPVSKASVGSPTKNQQQHEHQHQKPLSPHQEAIEFELSISFNGRKYTATRTMERIIKLRNELVCEMNDRRKWLQMRESRQTLPSEDDEHSSKLVEIPEIPPISEGDDNGYGAGFVGRGFTMVHAALRSYCPSMERWLRNLLLIVPQDSECLMKFLWEPLSDSYGDLSIMSMTNSSKLGSIQELDDDDDGPCTVDESDYDWDG